MDRKHHPARIDGNISIEMLSAERAREASPSHACPAIPLDDGYY